MAKILIIEDDAVIAAIEKDYLELSGYEVNVCADGVSGLTAALEQPFDPLLLDLMLPGMDGFAVCRRGFRTCGGRRRERCALWRHGAAPPGPALRWPRPDRR